MSEVCPICQGTGNVAFGVRPVIVPCRCGLPSLRTEDVK